MRDMPKLGPCNPGDRIAFFGPMVSGKTYCANVLQQYMYYEKFAFASKLKQIAKELYGVEGKSGNDRTLLQTLGQDLRQYDPDVWIKYLLQSVKDYEARSPEETMGHSRVVLDDLRYTNEESVLRDNGFLIFLVLTPEEERKQRIASLYPGTPASVYYHASEREWQGMTYDGVINSSLTAPHSVLEQLKDALATHQLVSSNQSWTR